MKLYHFYRPPEKMVGTKLVPLSTLQRFASELADKHASKYRNRDWFQKRGGVAKIRIPCLSCTLADVVQLFAIPPALIQERQKLLGGPPEGRRYGRQLAGAEWRYGDTPLRCDYYSTGCNDVIGMVSVIEGV